MLNHKRILALILLVVLLTGALPAMAQEQTLKMTGGSLNITSNPGSGKTLAKLSKYETLLVLEQAGEYAIVQAGGITGYVSAQKIKDINASALVKGIAVFNTAMSLDGQSVAKGDYAQILQTANDNVIVRIGGKTAAVPAQNVTQYNDQTSPQGVLAFAWSAKANNGPDKSDKKLFSIAAGEVLELLKTDSKLSIVRKGAQVGVIENNGVTAFTAKSQANGEVTLKSASYIYGGPGSKYGKRLKVPAGAIMQKLDIYKNYTLVRYEGVYGLVETRLITGKTTSSGNQAQYPPITTLYVVLLQNAHVYAQPEENAETRPISKGSTYEYVATTTDGQWVKIRLDNVYGYIKREFVDNYTPKDNSGNTPLPKISYSPSALEQIDVMNVYRISEGKQALKVDDILMRAAYVRAQELTEYFSHIRPNGLEPNSLHNSITGEIMGRGPVSLVPDANSIGAHFMNSPAHKQIAMSGNYTKTGAANVTVNNVIYFVQLFG